VTGTRCTSRGFREPGPTAGLKPVRCVARNRPDDMLAASRIIKKKLSGGGWYRCSSVRDICVAHRTTYPIVAEFLHLAESDYGYFCCLPGPATPIEAPDERSVRQGCHPNGEKAKKTQPLPRKGATARTRKFRDALDSGKLDGLNAAEIARRYSISIQTVSKWISERETKQLFLIAT
jgi:hypothetical protein